MTHITLTCEDLVKYLSDYLDHHLDEDLTQAAQAHLATCDNCRVVLDSTQKTILLYREQGQAIQLPTGRKHALYEHLAETFAKRPTP
jgi:anti-sigma factor RsiW